MTPTTREEERLIDSFRKAFPYKIMTAPPHGELRFTNQEIEDFLLSTHRTAREEGRREGRREALEGLKEEMPTAGKLCECADGYSNNNRCLKCREVVKDMRTANDIIVKVAALIEEKLAK